MLIIGEFHLGDKWEFQITSVILERILLLTLC